jgi:hypothetical protein
MSMINQFDKLGSPQDTAVFNLAARLQQAGFFYAHDGISPLGLPTPVMQDQPSGHFSLAQWYVGHEWLAYGLNLAIPFPTDAVDEASFYKLLANRAVPVLCPGGSKMGATPAQWGEWLRSQIDSGLHRAIKDYNQVWKRMHYRNCIPGGLGVQWQSDYDNDVIVFCFVPFEHEASGCAGILDITTGKALQITSETRSFVAEPFHTYHINRLTPANRAEIMSLQSRIDMKKL